MTDISPRNGHSTEPVPLGHLPKLEGEHRERQADIDPRAARRAERQVVTMFMLSILFTVLFVVAYVGIDKSTSIYLPLFGDVYASNLALGTCLGLAILFIGTAAIQWAKKLMPAVEVVQERHEQVSPIEATDEAAANYERGRDESGFVRFKMIRRTMIAALALFPIPLIVMLKDLWVPTPAEQGKSPAEILSTTMWTTDMRIVSDGTYQPVRPEDLPVGGLISAVPEKLREVEEVQGNLNARAKAAIILVRMEPDEIRAQQGDGWDYQGILAYSKICTHVGCPIALYEQRTHHLLCPCHQSTFDLADAGNVVFGPAARRMPQLPIKIDAEGYLVAVSDFAEPIGPSFWERG